MFGDSSMNVRQASADLRRLLWLYPVALLVAVGLATVLVQAAAPNQDTAGIVSLPLANGYLVTGNYVVGSVDLPHQGTPDGFLTGTVHMSGVPAEAEILSAFLYWETIATSPAQLEGVKFRGHPIHMDDIRVVKKSSASLTGSTASCFSSGGGSGATYTMYMMRADVRRLLPLEVGANDWSTRKRLVNDADLENFVLPDGTLAPLPYHTVTLPEAGTGNQVPQSAGASLVVIYRLATEPLRRILLYDGIAVIPDINGATFSQTVRGIFKSDVLEKKSSRMTLIAGSGQPSAKDAMAFNGTPIAADPFIGTSVSSDRAWSDVTFDSQQQVGFKNLMPGPVEAGYGET